MNTMSLFDGFFCTVMNLALVVGSLIGWKLHQLSVFRMQADARRYQWLAARLIGADFNWNDSGKVVLAFDWPGNVAVGGNCTKNIDAAMKAVG